MPTNRSLEIRLCQIGAVFAGVVATFVVLGVGCTETTPAPVAQKNGTDPNKPLLGSDAGWADAAVPENLTATQACARYMRAICERKNECGLATDDCTKAVANCPDSLFSPGSNRDPQTTWQCAFEMRQRSCQDVYLSVNPDCVTRGNKKPGESCISSAQCESLACTGSGSSCGTCIKRVGKDEDCSDMTSVVCDRGLTCNMATSVCMDLPEREFADVVSTGFEIGKPCNVRNLCTTGAYCLLTDGGDGICTARVAESEPCVTSDACIEGTYCFIEGSTCRKIPSAYEKCGNDVMTGNAIWCTDDSYCDQDGGYMCKPLPVAGEPCATTLFSGGPIICADSAMCDNSVEPPVCVALSQPGEPCTEDATCQIGLKCLCPDAACEQKSCGVVRDIEESCATPGESCNSVSTCTDGVCKANPSQDLYTTLCGG